MASGPSLIATDVETVRSLDIPLIGCNEQSLLGVDVLYVPDWKWLDYWSQPERDQARRHAWERHSLRYCGSEGIAEEFDGWTHVRCENRPGDGFSFDPGFLHTGGHAGFAIINFAVLMGAARILLLGYDMQKVNGARHWFGHHPKNTTLDVDSPYESFLRAYPFTVPQLAAQGVEVINCTPGSALTVYPSMDLADALMLTEQAKYQKCYALPNYRMGPGRLKRCTQDIETMETGATYLDVACGRGEMVKLARGRGIIAKGLDFVPELCDGVSVVQGDMRHMPFDDRGFDFVSCYDAIEHLPPEQVPMVLDELFRVVDRVLLVTTNNQRSHLDDLELHLTRMARGWWDEHLASRAQAINPKAKIERSVYGSYNHEWHWRIEL